MIQLIESPPHIPQGYYVYMVIYVTILNLALSGHSLTVFLLVGNGSKVVSESLTLLQKAKDELRHRHQFTCPVSSPASSENRNRFLEMLTWEKEIVIKEGETASFSPLFKSCSDTTVGKPVRERQRFGYFPSERQNKAKISETRR